MRLSKEVQRQIAELEQMAREAESRAEEYLRNASPEEAEALIARDGGNRIVREGWIEAVLGSLQSGRRAWNQAVRGKKVKEIVLQKAEELSRLYRMYLLGNFRAPEASELVWYQVMVEDPDWWDITPEEALEEEERLQEAEEEAIELTKAWLRKQS